MASVEKAPFYKRWLFSIAMRRGIAKTHSSDSLEEPKPFDRFVWAPIREKLGLDRLRIVLLGGAPCAPYLLEFLRICLRASILQGYGLTETFGVISLTHANDPHLGHVGLPIGCQVRLRSIEESALGSQTGEILVSGENLFMGYYRDILRTREAFSGNWFRTGDVGRFNPNGTISVVDRIKTLFKLSHGEYISPEILEAAYIRSPAVGQIFVYGNSSSNFVVAIIVPDAHWVLEKFGHDIDAIKAKKELSEHKFNDFSVTFSSLCKKLEKELKEVVLASLKECEENLRRFEVIRDIYLETKLDETLCGFSVKNDRLTPSFKLRRHILSKFYNEQLKSMYLSVPID